MAQVLLEFPVPAIRTVPRGTVLLELLPACLSACLVSDPRGRLPCSWALCRPEHASLPGLDILGTLLLESALFTWSHQSLTTRCPSDAVSHRVAGGESPASLGVESGFKFGLYHSLAVGPDSIFKKLELVLPHL